MTVLTSVVMSVLAIPSGGSVAQAESPLFLAYPPPEHTTRAKQIFFIGSAPPNGTVTINGTPVPRSPAGHFAPSFPLQLGANAFTIRHAQQTIATTITRIAATPTLPTGLNFAPNSLTPAQDMARLPGEVICFGAIAPPNATVTVKLGTQTVPLSPQPPSATLPPNSAVLTQQNQPQAGSIIHYQGCIQAPPPGTLGKPEFLLNRQGQTVRQEGPGRITSLNPATLAVVAVTVDEGIARTGPGTDYSRLTPLPKGTRAAVTGQDGEWLRLDYGGWIRSSETQTLPGAVPPRTTIRSILSRPAPESNPDRTEVRFPLEVPVPVTVKQETLCDPTCRLGTFTLTLHNTTAQTDTIYVKPDPIISRLDWQQVAPHTVQYTFNLKSTTQWGYQLRYEGTTLVLTLRHPPMLHQSSVTKPLAGLTILLDPGHGGPEDSGAVGPTGYPEKNATLKISQLVRTELIQRGATVHLTRETDVDLPLGDRLTQINQVQPTVSLSLHYNALPDDGDAQRTQGIGTFWYHPQAHDLAQFLHDSLVKQLGRSPYGVYWNNLALTRPTIAPSILVELGFMTHPDEFEWITNPQSQNQLAIALADGLVQWVQQTIPPSQKLPDFEQLPTQP